MSPRVVIVDNYDSFTYNLVQLVAGLTGIRPRVVTHDVSLAEVGLDGATHVIVSPGPGHPGRPRDFGVCADVLRSAQVPVLGVCLGHQGIAALAGGHVVAAPRVVHGYRSSIEHSGQGIFAGVPQGISVVRYHSLAVAEPVPAELRVTARADDGVVMALEHRHRALVGIQFHPESVLSEHGRTIVGNFLGRPESMPVDVTRSTAQQSTARVQVRRIAGAPDAEAIYRHLFAGAERSFWLDSASLAEEGSEPPRFSFLGAARSEVEASGADAVAALATIDAELADVPAGADTLPFEFVGGYVGYLAYELGKAFGYADTGNRGHADIRLLSVDRFVAVDHDHGIAYAVAVGEEDHAAWLDLTRDRIRSAGGDEDLPLRLDTRAFRPQRSRARYLSDIQECLAAIREGESYELCLTTQLELALDAPIDPLAVYIRLRRSNSAPYAALLRFPELAVASSSPELFLRVDRSGRVVSKPIKGTRPRGASAADDRAIREELSASPKDRAENLMIADLVRNDLGRVCQIGSVVCQPLMDVETFATVHQLVTTVSGQLEPGVGLVDILEATFPGGSMTGAPKRRSIEILARLEGAPRGVYSGAIGYLGFGRRACLSMAIRTAVIDAGRIAVGAGGAIVEGSEPLDEYDEMLHKAGAVLGALAATEVRRAGP